MVFDYFEVFLMSSKPNDHRLKQFSDYLLNNYVSNDAAFPPNIWAAATADLNRTTNACESFHSNFNKSFNSSHPHIFIFLDKLKQIQVENYIKINSINEPHKYRNSKSKKKYIYMQNIIKKYKNNEISIDDYVGNVAHYFGDFNKKKK